MELVYLWVEEYKNIHCQGFNFSPRFRCEFKAEYEINAEGHEKLRDDCELIICDKEDAECKNKEGCKEFCSEPYIKDFFDDNINVTAIVGKNGSGKSSVIEILSDIFGACTQMVLYKYILVYKNNKTYNLTTNLENIKFPNFLELFDRSGFGTGLLEDYSESIVLKITNELQKRTFYDAPLSYVSQQFFELNTRYQNTNYLKKVMLKNYFLKKDNDVSKDFFTPNKFKLTILFDKLQEDNKLFSDTEKIESLLKEARDYYESKDYSKCFLKVLDLMDLKTELIREEDFQFSFIKQYSKNNYYYKETLRGQSELFSKEIYCISDISDELMEFIFDLPNNYFAIELFENDIEFKDLSFGEQQLLSQLNYIVAKANLDTYEEYIPPQTNGKDEWGDEYKTRAFTKVLVFLDEFELGLHPLWQKNIIDYIVSFLSPLKDKDFHLILTTHSPFLLSDIPKQNIIFLDKDTESKAMVVKDGLKDKKETFGANIHTLLSDSFFMSDGLMGKFAKSKIDKAFELLNKQVLEKEEIAYCEQIIAITGEPILKTQMQKMLDSKRLQKIDKIEELERQIETLTAQVEELRN